MDRDLQERDQQDDLRGTEATRGLLDSLLANSWLYHASSDYKALLDFVVRLRNFAPFNAMLLQIQKPGLTYAASAADWWAKFERQPKDDARPLLILWPFGPVALVYDIMDTEGKDIPPNVSRFAASGPITESKIAQLRERTAQKNIIWHDLDAGDAKAGSIRCEKRATSPREQSTYRLSVNRNHPPPARFATLVHELAHLLLGHLGADAKLGVPKRARPDHWLKELEAESVAYVVCRRNGVAPMSETYLANFVNQDTTTDDLDIYRIMRAAGRIEHLLGLTAQVTFTGPAGP
jgi:hypothetical protein